MQIDFISVSYKKEHQPNCVQVEDKETQQRIQTSPNDWTSEFSLPF